jgi:hypothetical protein
VGISTFVRPYVAGVTGKSGLPAQQWATYGALVFNVGAFFGQIAYGFLAARFGASRPHWLISRGLRHDVGAVPADQQSCVDSAGHGGECVLLPEGPFSSMPARLPELFPTHLHATAAAFGFNPASSRFRAGC